MAVGRPLHQDGHRDAEGVGQPGVASAAAFALLYRTLAIGPMNVLSPVTALVSAALPVGVGLLQGEHLPAAGVMRRRPGSERPAYAMSAAAGVLDSVANLLFLLAARGGDLTVVAVITALYPAGTVLLARAVLAERIHRGQLIGLGAVAVSLVAMA
ncbi:EamA family transporter [Microbispora sp. ZYX-F-249]|uniref:EamA family transporter n=1 Tax=Microbispora maris TaxID=3144104 RepID=A0ABV0AYL2_9ACTN